MTNTTQTTEPRTTQPDIECVRELLDHPAFEDMPRNFQVKVIMASEAFDRIAERLRNLENVVKYGHQ